MPRRRSNLGRRTRQANKEYKRRYSRTVQERLEENERVRIRIYKKRAEELADKREERLKYLREDAKRRRAVHSSQQRLKQRNERLRQIQNLNDQAPCEVNFPYEPDIQINTPFEFIQIEIEEEIPKMHCTEKQPEQNPEEPLNNLSEITENFKHFLDYTRKDNSEPQI